MWLFGYGSLIWRPDFDYVESHPAVLPGWRRRFWQGSTDHRGIPDAPGRVVTLVPDPAYACYGMAYRISAGARRQVLAALDHREQGGYLRTEVDLRLSNGDQVDGVTYWASQDNPNYLGPAPVAEMAGQILASAGPSGPNSDYLWQLESSLLRLGGRDVHVMMVCAVARGMQCG